MNNTNFATFMDMDLGSSKPTSVPMETVEVGVAISDMVSGYARAFVNECYRVHPLRAQQVDLTEDEMTAYAHFLLVKRIETVNQNCSDFRRLKALYIPSFLQYVLSMIGLVEIRERGLRIVPYDRTEGETITLDEAFRISEKIGMFIDELQIVQDAMPRDIHGDKDVMSTALIAGYVRSLNEVSHVAATYVSAFMDFKLKQETAFQALYRVQYDDVAFIASAFTTQRGLF